MSTLESPDVALLGTFRVARTGGVRVGVREALVRGVQYRPDNVFCLVAGHHLTAARRLGAGATADAIDNIPTAVVGAAGPAQGEGGDTRCPICLEVRAPPCRCLQCSRHVYCLAAPARTAHDMSCCLAAPARTAQGMSAVMQRLSAPLRACLLSCSACTVRQEDAQLSGLLSLLQRTAKRSFGPL